MGVWTNDPKTGKSVWRDEFPDTPEGRQAAQQDTNKRSQSQASQQGANTYNAGGTGSTGGATKADPGTSYGYEQGASGNTAEDRSKAIYEYRPGEKTQDFMQRVFQQGTRDFGGVLSPSVDNPYGRTPYAQWFQNRYQNVVPANIMLEQLLGNELTSTDSGQDTESKIKAFMGGGPGRGYGGGTNQAGGNLGELNNLLNAYAKDPNMAGLSPMQATTLRGLQDDPSGQLALVNAQVAGSIGANPFSSKGFQTLGQGLLDQYYDDPVGNNPATQGSYLQNLLKRMHMSQ